jgi:hypothetical protein
MKADPRGRKLIAIDQKSSFIEIWDIRSALMGIHGISSTGQERKEERGERERERKRETTSKSRSPRPWLDFSPAAATCVREKSSAVGKESKHKAEASGRTLGIPFEYFPLRDVIAQQQLQQTPGETREVGGKPLENLVRLRCVTLLFFPLAF